MCAPSDRGDPPEEPLGFAEKPTLRRLLVTLLCLFTGALGLSTVFFIRTVFLPEPVQATPAGSLPATREEAPRSHEAPEAPPFKEDGVDQDAAAPAVEEGLPVKSQGRLAFVIDDAGNNLDELEPFLRFPGPLTIAVLPGLPCSGETARRVQAAGKELFLHQPMEALGGQYPGPGAIYTGMSAETIRTMVEANLAELGAVVGMNNHQGSKTTQDHKAMEIILSLCRDRGLYFLDSRTIAGTVAPEVARRLGIPIGERDVFIDNTPEKAAMRQWIETAQGKARRSGSAILIGHAWSPALAELLQEIYPSLIEQGYSLTTVSGLIALPRP